jgi:hypothetical protein
MVSDGCSILGDERRNLSNFGGTWHVRSRDYTCTIHEDYVIGHKKCTQTLKIIPYMFPKCRVTPLQVHSLQKKYCIFYANNVLIAKFTRPTSHTSNTVDKLNKSKLSGLVNVFTMVRQLVCW